MVSFAFSMDRVRKGYSRSSSSGRTAQGIKSIASCAAIGARVNVSQGLDPVGKDWLRRRVRASKYGE